MKTTPTINIGQLMGAAVTNACNQPAMTMASPRWFMVWRVEFKLQVTEPRLSRRFFMSMSCIKRRVTRDVISRNRPVINPTV